MSRFSTHPLTFLSLRCLHGLIILALLGSNLSGAIGTASAAPVAARPKTVKLKPATATPTPTSPVTATPSSTPTPVNTEATPTPTSIETATPSETPSFVSGDGPLGPKTATPTPTRTFTPGPSPTPTSTVFYDQLTGNGGTSISSLYGADKNQAADDFIVPTGNTWTINTVEVVGMHSGTPAVDSVTVQFYQDSGTALPGTLVYSNTVDLAHITNMASGSFTLSLSPAATLAQGSYWLSVQANKLSFPGNWFWVEHTPQANNESVWRGPFSPCPSWAKRITICQVGIDRDFLFRLSWLNGPPPTITPTLTPSTTPTASNTPTITPTPTATPIISNTGWKSPSAQAADTGGHNDGYEVSPANAFNDNSVFAVDNNSGTNTSTSCTDSGKDRHRFYNYALGIPAGSLINGIQVRLDAKADATTGSPKLCVELSWNGGANWTAVQSTATLTKNEATYLLGSSTDTWGRTWSAGDFSDANFRLRITDVASNNARDFSLDWAAVQVFYIGPTPTVTPTPSNTPTPTATAIGNLIVNSNTTLAAGVYTYTRVLVTNNATLTLQGNTANGTGVTIFAQSVQVDAGASISANGQGYAGTYGNGEGPGGGLGGSGRGGGAGHGGYGASADYTGGGPYDDVYTPTQLGSGGGGGRHVVDPDLGGNGGGAIRLNVSGTVTINGSLTANGNNGEAGNYFGNEGGGGGGSGGSILISTGTLAGTGQISANGGSSQYAGGGAGGRIAINYTSNSFTGNVQTYGGGGFAIGGPGTLYWTALDQLIVDNNNQNGTTAALVSGNYTFTQIILTRYGHLNVLGTGSNLTLTTSSALGGDGTATLAAFGTVTTPASFSIQGATLNVQGQLSSASNVTVGGASGATGGLVLRASTPLRTGAYAFTTFTVNATGTVTLYPSNNGNTNYTDDAPFELIASTLTINSGGQVNTNGLGYVGTYANGNGPGGGLGGSGLGSGAGHGGTGGSGSYASGVPYENISSPTQLGSGGGGGTYGLNWPLLGGQGGGAIHLNVSGTFILNGTLSADGANGEAGNYFGNTGAAGGGSGGAVWIQAGTLSGNGLIHANGGSSEFAGGGAGGRITFDYTTSSFSGTAQAYGGAGVTQSGGPGTIYWTPENRLTIDNANQNGAAAGLLSGNYSFTQIELTRYGHLDVLGTSSNLTLANGNVLSGDGTGILAAFGTLTAPASTTIQGATLDVRGERFGMSNLVIANQGGVVLRASTPLHTGPHVFVTITVQENGKLTLIPNNNGNTNYTDDAPFVLQAQSLTVNSNGLIHSDGQGYTAGAGGTGYGPGGGQGLDTGIGYVSGAGGGYGGFGGERPPYLGGSRYGSASQPDQLGSAGGSGFVADVSFYGLHLGGKGGGAMHLSVSGTLTNNGLISASGFNGTGGSIGTGTGGSGGGSGGSIWIDASTLAGSGKLLANGGNGYYGAYEYNYGSGGGGGRIAVHVQAFNFTGRGIVNGGRGYRTGENGTIWGFPLPARTKLSGGSGKDNKHCPICELLKVVGGPIDTQTGAVQFNVTDLSLPVLGGQLTFERWYSTAATNLYTTTLGYGWTHSLDTRLIFPTDPGGIAGQVLFKANSANQFIFYLEDDGTYTPYPGVQDELTHNGDGTYTLTNSDQTRYTFNSAGELTVWTDSAGRTWTYTYTSNRLTQVTSGTRYIQLSYDGSNRLQTAADHTGRSVTYHYDANGDLDSVTDVLGQVWMYSYDGTSHRLTQATDPLGHIIERDEYDAQGRAIRQYNGNNQLVLELGYNLDGTTTITNGLGITTTHTYDTRNTLTNETNALGGTVNKTFDQSFHADSVTDEAGHTTQVQWSDDGATLMGVTNALSQTTSLAYDALNQPTVITDSRGLTSTFTYSGTLLLSSTDALGHTTSYTYTTAADAPQPPNLLKATTDALGNTTRYAYNEFGQTTLMTNAVGTLTIYSYNNLGRLVTSTTAVGTSQEQTSINTYDAAGRLTQSTRNYLAGQAQNYLNQYNLITRYGYDLAGNQTVITDTVGQVARNVYDNDNRLIQTTQNVLAGQPQNYLNQYNLVTSYGYNALGLQTLVTDTVGRVTKTEYDSLNRPVTMTVNYVDGFFNPAQSDEDIQSTTQYDAVGNVTLSAQYANIPSLARTIRTEYDALNRPMTTTVNYEDGFFNPAQPDEDLITVTHYDVNGNVDQTTDPLGHVTQIEYDALNRPVTTTVNYIDGFFDPAKPDEDVRSIMHYDAVGNVDQTIDPLGHVTQTTYDALNRPTVVTNPLSGTNITTYDSVGNVIATTDALSRTTTYSYDNLNRLTAVTDPISGTTTYEYDALANRLAATDALSHTTTYTYDALNRMVSVTNPVSGTTTTTYDIVGNVITSTDALNHATTFTYDALNRQLNVTDPLNHTTAITCDGVGNKVSMQDANGVVTAFEYDKLSRLTAVVENYKPGFLPTVEINVRTEYTYDALGNQLTIKDGNEHVTQFTYDALNRQLTQRDPLNHTQTSGYDAVGNVISTTDALSRTTSYQYDALNRLVTIDYPAPDTAVTFTYDAVGNRTVMTDTVGTTTWTYDALNRPLSITDPFTGTVGYDYDPVGNRTQLTYPDSKVVTYTYDAANRLEEINASFITAPVTYTYDAANRLTNMALPNGITSAYTYDNANRLLDLTHSTITGTLASYAYTVDSVGNRTQATENVKQPAGSTQSETITYNYDPLYRLTGADYDNGNYFHYAYDAVGNRLTQEITGTVVTTYTYDITNRLTNVGATAYTWDNNGNLLNDGVYTNTYDAANRPITITNGTTTNVFAYNGDGVRLKQTVNGTVTTYTVDLAAGLTQVLVDVTSGVTNTYLYGNGRIAQNNSGNGASYFLGDALGSVRQLTDSNGAVTLSKSYQPYGSVLSTSGSGSSAYGFTGEWTDNTGLVYLRARYYMSGVGRFVSKDMWPGDYNNPLTLNGWNYTAGNPINRIDPSGQCYRWVGPVYLDDGLYPWGQPCPAPGQKASLPFVNAPLPSTIGNNLHLPIECNFKLLNLKPQFYIGPRDPTSLLLFYVMRPKVEVYNEVTYPDLGAETPEFFGAVRAPYVGVVPVVGQGGAAHVHRTQGDFQYDYSYGYGNGGVGVPGLSGGIEVIAPDVGYGNIGPYLKAGPVKANIRLYPNQVDVGVSGTKFEGGLAFTGAWYAQRYVLTNEQAVDDMGGYEAFGRNFVPGFQFDHVVDRASTRDELINRWVWRYGYTIEEYP